MRKREGERKRKGGDRDEEREKGGWKSEGEEGKGLRCDIKRLRGGSVRGSEVGRVRAEV